MSFSKELWGNNMWYLFHTIAHKIKESEFAAEKSKIIDILKSICKNLPCPDCSADATTLLNKVDFSSIKSKEDFKLFLFKFHNHVNHKLKKPEFLLEELDKKYEKANIHALYRNFHVIFSANSKVPQMMMHSFQRQSSEKSIMENLNSLLPKME